ncbi:MAG: UDP-N-acetylglucosamine--N-acetylmuramyl-(pentapeptide) pyrophosphoryl-undecaprenol N-acetylglucosamine transferase [Acidimicrobiales bacterium]
MSERRFALVTGGGTAGHTVPALAVARALLEDKPAGSIEMVGSKRGLDAKLLSGVELPVTLLGGRGFRRRMSGSAFASNLAALVGLVGAFVSSVALVLTRRPRVVVAVGGYACMAPSVAAAILGVPIVVLNVDAVPGAANRLLSRIARASAVAYPGTALPRSVVTGPPVRSEILAVRSARDDATARSAAREALGLPSEAFVVAAFGGSLGAKRINEAVLGLADQWSGRGDVAIYHVVGNRDSEWATRAASEMSGRGRAGGGAAGGELAYVQVSYENRMDLLYTACDMAVCRAGANTVAELTVTGTPAVLVPLPGAPGDHQNANAKVLERNGAAVVVQDRDLEADRLAKELNAILADPGKLAQMAAASADLGKPDAARAVAELAEKFAHHGGAGSSRGAGNSGGAGNRSAA